jgi:hypothetical protein
MKDKKNLEIAATIALGGICAFLVLRLVVRVRSVNAGPSRSVVVTPVPLSHRVGPVKVLAPETGGLSDGPVLNVALFEQIEAHVLAEPGRDPFEFPPTPQQVEQTALREAAQARRTGPPPPPPVPLKALGYMQDAHGQLQAYLSDSQNIYAVHEGQQFDKTYRVLKVTPAYVEIEDVSLNLRAQLAIPQ